MFKKLLNIIRCTWLCIRYPYLYPRNRFTDRHWNNWKINDYLYGTRSERKYKGFDKASNKVLFEIIPANPGLKGKAYRIDIDFTDPICEGGTIKGKINKVIISYPYWILFHLVEFAYNWILPIFHCIPTWTEWDAMPEGWAKAFGKQYLKEFDKAVRTSGWLEPYRIRIFQIKEKWGMLQLYVSHGNPEMYRVITKYENLSYYTCINCGKPATKLTQGWITPYCDDCCHSDNYAVLDSNGHWKYYDN